MPKPTRDDVLARLLAQDAPVDPERYHEYRMHINDVLKGADRRERRARWVLAGLWIVTFVNLCIGAYLANALLVQPLLWCASIGVILFIAATVETFFYVVRYRPALTRANDRQQAELLRDLERQVADLSRRLESERSSASDSS